MQHGLFLNAFAELLSFAGIVDGTFTRTWITFYA